ncbi:hypothetical protein [Streptomyces sp. KLOTTS4A1]|uniref:hypothetical protein n=1 Tax=Streptomyces sp. KLOTTS4A1 TaxID=3390996 RepID=UPI0039F5ED0A
MSLLHAIISTARMLKHTKHLAAGLPGDDEVLLDAPDDRLAPALVAAGQGEYGPAAALLAATREQAAWENRDLYTRRLAAFARSRPDWFERWLAGRPHDPDARLVKAELALGRAWDSPAYAELLRDAGPLISAAADGAPRDPVPWRLALDHARGTHATRAVFDTLWEQATSRASHHYGCHTSAVQYLSAAWYGSHRESFDFAERAAEDALPGSLLHALPIRAALPYLTDPDPLPGRPGTNPLPPRHGTGLLPGLPGLTGTAARQSRNGPDRTPGRSVPDMPPTGAGTPPGPAGPASLLGPERLDAAADRAIALSAAYPVGDPYPAEVRNLLTYVLIRLERWPEALDQLRMTGRQATSFPWDRLSDDPLGQFLELRDGIRLQVAADTPLWAGRGAVGGPVRAGSDGGSGGGLRGGSGGGL